MRWSPLFLILIAAPAAAQRLAPEPPRAPVAFESRSAGPPLVPSNDYAWEGAKAGAVILGIGGIGLGYGLCSEGDNGHSTTFGYCAPRALLGGLIAATVGAGLGALIGSAFPKAPPASQ